MGLLNIEKLSSHSNKKKTLHINEEFQCGRMVIIIFLSDRENVNLFLGII